MSDTFICHRCGYAHPMSQRYEFHDQDLCPECLARYTTTCSHCGERIWSYSNVGDEQTILCSDCYDAYFTNCQECGCILERAEAYFDDDDEYICANCHQSTRDKSAIRNYYFKPAPIFYGDGPRYFGVELEIDRGGESENNARMLLSIANTLEDLMYCKHDGSLDDGFEMVTHPMTLSYHLERMPWKDILRKAIDLAYWSHKGGTCGLHVHVNRSALGTTTQDQDAVIARILYFMEKNWEELLKFSRRTAGQLERWAARYGYQDRPKEILDKAKKGYGGRYVSVNLENNATIEFRIFRGTLKYNTLIATLQMVNRICDVALFLSDEEIRDMSWTTFVSGCQEKELVQYLKERRLYINEPIITEEEI